MERYLKDPCVTDIFYYASSYFPYSNIYSIEYIFTTCMDYVMVTLILEKHKNKKFLRETFEVR